MKSNSGNGNERLPGGIGGGSIQIPQSVLLRKPGRQFHMPVDRAKMKAEVEARIVAVEENKTTLHAIGDWLIDIDRASPAERDQFEAEIRAYAGDLEIATKDSNPAIRRVGTYEWLRWQFSSKFVSWEKVGEVIADFASKGILVNEKNPEQFLCRCGQNGYTIEQGLDLEPAQLAEIKSWFVRIAGEIKTHTCKGWEAKIGMMRQASVITLEQLVVGEPGPCYVVVPDDPDHKGKDGNLQPLEGGHLLVSSVNGKIFVEDVAGDPATGKGFAFVRRIQAVMDLRPKAFMGAYKLRFWSPFKKRRAEEEMNEAELAAQFFFDQNPDHAKACTVVHASIKRAIKLAFKEGKFDNSKTQVKYLFDDSGQANPVQANQQKPEVIADTKKKTKKVKKADKPIEASSSPAPASA